MLFGWLYVREDLQKAYLWGSRYCLLFFQGHAPREGIANDVGQKKAVFFQAACCFFFFFSAPRPGNAGRTFYASRFAYDSRVGKLSELSEVANE